MPTVHLLIKGRVQGVYYRASAKDVADEIGVKGWVKNTEDGNVEIQVTGNDEQLHKFIAWCKIGPRRAVVDEVITTPKEDIDFDLFRIVRG